MKFLKRLTPFTLPFLLAACGDDDLDTSGIQAPNVYEFSSRSASSVDYKEVTTQMVLIKELEYLIGSGHLQTYALGVSEEGIINLLNQVYEGGSSNLIANNLYDSSTTPTPISGITTDLDKLQIDFSSFPENVNLKSKMPGENTDLIHRDSDDSQIGNLIGWSISGILNKDEDQLSNKMIQAWFASIAKLAKDEPGTTFRSNGFDYQALVTSYLSTAIPYFQATNILLNSESGLKANNTSQDPYTALQHNWDLAFAYFGASRQYKTNNKTQNSSANGLDGNGDEHIDLFSEYNFLHAKTTANLDNTTVLTDTDYSQIIMQAFLNGRQLIDDHIANGNETLLSELNNQARIIRKYWELSIAAQLIHHLNNTSQLVTFYGQNAVIDAAYARSWAYTKSYAIALQFNPSSIITFDQLTETQTTGIHALISQSPETTASKLRSYQIKLLTARDLIAAIYDFSETNTLNW